MSPAQQVSPARAKAIFATFCLVFIGAGLAMWIPWFVLPTLDWWAMRSWKPVPCTIVKSPAGQGDANSPDLVYRYEWDGAAYESGNLGTGGIFGLGEAPLWTLPPGTTRTAYVNPRDAHQAALNRDFDPETLFGCASLMFVILPLFALLAGWNKIGKPPEAPPPPLPPLRDGARTILPTPRGGCGITAILLMMIVCGGASVALVWLVAPKAGAIVYVYAVPFGFVALLLLRLLVHIGLASFNPRVTLTLTPGQAAPGRPLELRWEAEGDVSRVKSFRILLEGREEAPLGKSMRTEAFTTLDVFQSGSRDLRRGLAKVALPDGAMHSLTHGRRRIVWAFKILAECPRWRRGGEEYEFEVLPRKAGSP